MKFAKSCGPEGPGRDEFVSRFVGKLKYDSMTCESLFQTPKNPAQQPRCTFLDLALSEILVPAVPQNHLVDSHFPRECM